MTNKDGVKICDICIGGNAGVINPNLHMQTPAICDGPTRLGPWAHMCQRHLISAGYPNSKMNYFFKPKAKEEAS